MAIEVGPEPPEAASTSRIPRQDRPPVILEIPAALQSLTSSLNLSSALTRLVNGSSPHHDALRERGLVHLPIHTVLESATLPMEDGVSNGYTTGINQMTKFLIPY